MGSGSGGSGHRRCQSLLHDGLYHQGLRQDRPSELDPDERLILPPRITDTGPGGTSRRDLLVFEGWVLDLEAQLPQERVPPRVAVHRPEHPLHPDVLKISTDTTNVCGTIQ